MENQLSLFGFEPEQRPDKEEKNKTKVSKKPTNADAAQSSDLFGDVDGVADEPEKNTPIVEDTLEMQTFSEEENDALSEIEQEMAETKEEQEFLDAEINEKMQQEESNNTDDVSFDNTIDTPIEHSDSFFQEENNAISEDEEAIAETRAEQDFLAVEINEQLEKEESTDIHDDHSFPEEENEFQQESPETKAEQEFLDAEINEQIQQGESNDVEVDISFSDTKDKPIEHSNSFFEEENSAQSDIPQAPEESNEEQEIANTLEIENHVSTEVKDTESPIPTFLSKTFEASKKGRKSFKEIDAELDLIQVPSDEMLFSKQYYPISQVAKWFRVNNSLLRFWENEFDILKPRKNRKGDRLFRPEDIKNLQIIYYLLRQKKYTIAGAKKYIKNNKKTVDVNMKIIQTLNDFKTFLLELKTNAQRQ